MHIKRQNIHILLSIVYKIHATTRDFKHLCRQTKKSPQEKRFLCVMCDVLTIGRMVFFKKKKDDQSRLFYYV